MTYFHESFDSQEQEILSRFFTNTDLPVFALINLPEVVKGALFARYSRSPKSIRRLFLDEFLADSETGISAIAARLGGDDPLVDLRRAEDLYQKVFFDFGDDSVAQLGGAHLACEQASNILTKALEWGRLGSYLEQSTRYIAYDTRLGDRYRYFIPPEIEASPLRNDYMDFMESLFGSYSALVAEMHTLFAERFPKAGDSLSAWNAAVRAKACDVARGLLPASTLSNVGIFASGQSYETTLIRMQASPLMEVRCYGQMMLEELRKVIPSFLTRVDKPNRGGEWSRYFEENAARLQEEESSLGVSASPQPWSVKLIDFDPEAEAKIVTAALFAYSEGQNSDIADSVSTMSAEDRVRILTAAVGDRRNRRHIPGRAFERTAYRFEVVCDFGAFRDLQRHRMLTVDWQRLTTRLGYDIPPVVEETGKSEAWQGLMNAAAETYENLRISHGPDVAQYVVPFASHIRFTMEMNPREAFHLIELRSRPTGHAAYRRVVQEMHRLIADQAGHRALAQAMKFVDRSEVGLERIESERAAERRREVAGTTD